MLQTLRDKLGGWPAKIVFGLMVFVFSFFGIEGYFVARNETWVAKVGGHEISQQDFQNSFNAYRQQQLQQPGNKLDAADFEKPAVKREVLDRVINRQVLVNANDALGLHVPDAAVRAQIMQLPQFQVDGKFNGDAYLAVLAANGKSPEAFQEEVRADLAVRQLPEAIAATSFATDADVDAYLRLILQKRDFRYVELPRPQAQNANVSDAEIATYYKAHGTEFMNPETVALSYLELNAADIKVTAATDDATLKARYDKEKSKFVASEQRLAAHILIAVPKNATPAQQKAALEKAQQIDAQAKAPGADFAKLAQQYSDDLGSKNQGGDLGWLQKGETDPAFENALFSMQKGQVSDPVLSPEGYHIIDLRDVRPGEVKSFAEVRDQLAQEASDEEREHQFSELGSKLTDLIYQDPTSLAPAAKALGLTVQTTAPFTRQGGTGITANPAVVKAAFSDQVLVQGNTSDPIDLGKDDIVVVHLSEHKPATPKPLAEVRDAIRGDILVQRADAAARQQADRLFARLQKDDDLDAIAQSVQQPVKQASVTRREPGAVAPDLAAAVFRMPRPAAGKDSRAVLPLGQGRYALVVLSKVADGDPASVPKQEHDFLRGQITQAVGSEDIRGLVDELRVHSKIQIAQDRLGQQ